MSPEKFLNRIRQRNKKTSRPKMIVDGAGVKRVQAALVRKTYTFLSRECFQTLHDMCDVRRCECFCHPDNKRMGKK